MALKKVLGRSRVTLTVLQTLITEVEAILNDRPLTYVPSDMSDPEPLTPSQLLHGRRIVSLPHQVVPHQVVTEQDLDDPTFGDTSEVNRRARLLSALLSQFWSRWRHEYLTSLREHHRASGNNAQQIQQGDVVLVHDDAPRISWKLAVVEELLRGNDGLVRAANIRTAQGKTNRPIAKLIPLEVSSPSMEDGSRDPDMPSQIVNNSNPSSNSIGENQIGRPKRRAAERAQNKVKNWVVELNAPPEDVTD